MQERKQTLADGSLGEGSGKKIGSEFFLLVHSGYEVLMVFFISELSVKELGRSFQLIHRCP
jgi:hypothetical protein